LKTALIMATWFETYWPAIRNFLLGMVTGFVLLSMGIAFAMISDRNRKRKIIMSKEEPLEKSAVRAMIKQKQDLLTETARIADNAYFRVAFDLSLELMNEIAKYYFPNSRYPMYELSPQELLDLNSYIIKRLEKIINGKFIRRFKNFRISTIIDILNRKKAIDNSKLMKFNRQFKISKILSYGVTILNYANPVYWFRKLALKPSTNLVTKELCKMIISIVGEETSNLYSKKMFATPDDAAAIEAQLDEVIELANSEPEPKPQ